MLNLNKLEHICLSLQVVLDIRREIERILKVMLYIKDQTKVTNLGKNSICVTPLLFEIHRTCDTNVIVTLTLKVVTIF